ncbi:hypothetical protein BUALT_Bualt10G0026100 [Buddleja alternifolia]|uniref:C2H2-type domain-containing protein n=1 Tax=Buddleja alternifolia TaxID=168488 RepID=A0AAV6WWM3_9LAMI|nr:hypothetical protein BUALT_Bualt10G0026100 [Buddleja alternifolia]
MGEENGEQEMSISHVIRHYCKVCNRGFGCAGALGGHMRAHVMGDGGDVNLRMKPGPNNKHSYFLRAKTPRPLMAAYHVMSDDDGEYKKSSSFGRRFELDQKERVSNFVDVYPASSEDEDLANCLVMLSSNNKGPKEMVENNKGIFQCRACKKVFNSHQALGGHRASHKKVKGCFAAKLDDEEDENHVNDEDSIQEDHNHHHHHEDYSYSLGTPSSEAGNKPKMHECSVCRRVFSSGQALGGHKRCHWLTTSTSDNNGFNIPSFQYDHQLYKKPMFTNHHHDQQLDLNLNLPAHHIENHAKGNIEMNPQQCTIDLNQQEKSEMKLRKLSDLRDVNLDGGWLQMGIATTTDIP